MATTSTPERAEQKINGQALRQLRERRAGVSQAHVAERLGMTTQAWQKYEAGERRFTEERIDDVLEILGATRADLIAERARALGEDPPRAVAEPRRSFVIDVFGRPEGGNRTADGQEATGLLDLGQLLGPRTGAVAVPGDALIPWAEPGEVVIFDRDRYPRRGGGCVIETEDGVLHVKIYDHSDGSTLFARERFPNERTVTFDLKTVRGVYAVKFRGD